MEDRRYIGLEMKKLEIVMTRYAMAYLRKVRDIDMCPLQQEALIKIHENGGTMIQKQLEESLKIRKSTLSGILSTMMKNGYIEKKNLETDQRSKIVTLTEKGKSAYDESVKDLVELEKLMMSGVSEEDREAFFRVADTIRKNTLD